MCCFFQHTKIYYRWNNQYYYRFGGSLHNINKRYLIWHSDDLGTQYGGNEGILEAATNGFLTSVSIRANGIAFEDAYKRIIPLCPQLGLGVHICLNEGNVISPPHLVPLLADKSGHFLNVGPIGFIRLALSGANKELKKQAEIEMRHQIETIINALNTTEGIDHIDGHQHIHAIPWVFKILLKLAQEYCIPFIRIPCEPLVYKTIKVHIPPLINLGHYCNLQLYSYFNKKNLKKTNINSNDYFFGLLHTNAMSEDVAINLLENIKEREGITEFLFHPAKIVQEPIYIEKYQKEFYLSPNRKKELEACCSQNVRNTIIKYNYELTNFRNLKSEF